MEKDKRKRRRLSSSPDVPDTDEPRNSKKDPTLGDEGTSSPNNKRSKRDSKHDKSKHRKHKSHHKSSSHSSHRKEKKSGDRNKVATHKHGDHHSLLKIQEISSDDYFSRNNEFATWLKEEKSLFFSDLSSESARDLFSEFVSRWNANKLEGRYYEGIGRGPRTSHKWNIKK